MRWFEGGLGPLSTALSSRGVPFSEEGCHGLGNPESVFGVSRAHGPNHEEGLRYSEASACCRFPRLLLTRGSSPAKAGALACASHGVVAILGQLGACLEGCVGATTARPVWVGPGLQATRAPPPDFLLRSGAESPPWCHGLGGWQKGYGPFMPAAAVGVRKPTARSE